MGDKLHFAVGLYQGTAEYYDRYRLPYPEAMTEDLIARAGVSGQGRLLDLACGTGQLAFPLRRYFAEVWAVDREPDFAQIVQAKAGKLGAGNIRPVAADADTLDAEPGHFELAVIGSAFHRLDRDLVAVRLLHWLQPGGCVALCWADVPQLGDREWRRTLAALLDREWRRTLAALLDREWRRTLAALLDREWQRTLAALLDRWQTALGATGRVPANWAEPQRRRPDAQVLSEAGFETARRHAFPVEHRWSLAELAGFVRSTSFLPPSVLGDQGAALDDDLAAAIGPFAAADGTFPHDVGFVYDLPASRRTRQSRVLRTCPEVRVSAQLVSAAGFGATIVS
jgi:ubiquinone/menaquinone biosynthesis C-methylase UbiE